MQRPAGRRLPLVRPGLGSRQPRIRSVDSVKVQAEPWRDHQLPSRHVRPIRVVTGWRRHPLDQPPPATQRRPRPSAQPDLADNRGGVGV